LLTLYLLTTRVTVHLHEMENRLDSATKLIVNRSIIKTLVTSFSLTLGVGVRTVTRQWTLSLVWVFGFVIPKVGFRHRCRVGSASKPGPVHCLLGDRCVAIN